MTFVAASQENVPILAIGTSDNVAIRPMEGPMRIIQQLDWLIPEWDSERGTFKVTILDVTKLSGRTLTCMSRGSQGYGKMTDKTEFKFVRLEKPQPVTPQEATTRVGVLVDDQAYTSNLDLNCSFQSTTAGADLLLAWFKVSHTWRDRFEKVITELLPLYIIIIYMLFSTALLH
ncbi:hypothetical protein Ciccas_011950 [Cichlidogyrus casuarinus]|uniref:Uncharacterized protein n=1 Tax=Cichlidogyrus casuarinus TaxID=1844966 RepID=A0ABD2PQN5_9PLAT